MRLACPPNLCSTTVRCSSRTQRTPIRPRRSVHLSRTPEPLVPGLADLLQSYEELEPQPIALSKLLSYGSPVTASSLLASASYTRLEIPRRLARAVRNLDRLPYICGTNPYIARTHKLYLSTFHDLASAGEITNTEENEAFSAQLARRVDLHANDIPTLSKGFSECARYMTPEAISSFLDTAITSRIGVRLIAEQHIALSKSLKEPHAHHEHRIGVVDLECSPERLIRMCASFVGSLSDASIGASPELVIDGVIDATFVYVPVHLEYILTEILKNAFRASVENHFALHGPSSSRPVPPVLVTISPSSEFLSLRVRDQGGGISPVSLPHVFSYAFTTAGRGSGGAEADESGGGPYAAQHVGGSAAIGGDGDGNLFGDITEKGLQTGMGTIAGLGYGLPLARLYANYFGGQLDLMTLYGHGTDIFLKLRRLDQPSAAEI